eukprot:scaffold1866_cov66-Cylindrotheca_fusiformis.AAC.6
MQCHKSCYCTEVRRQDDVIGARKSASRTLRTSSTFHARPILSKAMKLQKRIYLMRWGFTLHSGFSALPSPTITRTAAAILT